MSENPSSGRRRPMRVKITDSTFSGNGPAISSRGDVDLDIDNVRYKGPGPFIEGDAAKASIKNSKMTSTGASQSRAGSFIGYRKPIGAPLPAQCPHCSSIFASIHYNLSVPFFLVKNTTETCRVCGKPDATLAEGVFNLVGNLVRVVEAAEDSEAMLRAFGAIFDDFASGKASAEQTIAAVAAIEPSLAAKLKTSAATVLWLIFLVLIPAINGVYELDRNLTSDQRLNYVFESLAQVIVEVIDGVDDGVEQEVGNEEPGESQGKADDHSIADEEGNADPAKKRDFPSGPNAPKSP